MVTREDRFDPADVMEYMSIPYVDPEHLTRCISAALGLLRAMMHGDEEAFAVALTGVSAYDMLVSLSSVASASMAENAARSDHTFDCLIDHLLTGNMDMAAAWRDHQAGHPEHPGG